MASVAERQRSKKSRTVSRAKAAPVNDNAKPSRAIGALRRMKPEPKRDDGLDYLLDKQRITRTQAAAGRRYGSLYRTALISDAAAIRSFLDDTPRGGGGAGMPTTDLEAAAWIAESKLELGAAQAALGFHTGMILACDLVCGHGLRPREIMNVQRETEELETSLRLALDLLTRYFNTRRAEGR